jgi:O-glycosyl hydrolase
MKRARSAGVVMGGLLLSALAPGGCIRRAERPVAVVAVTAPAAVAVTVDPGQRHQTLEGFGASLAWHLDKVVGDPPAGIYDLIFPSLVSPRQVLI